MRNIAGKLSVLSLGVCALVLSGCVSKYVEPTSGDRARLRVARTGARVNTNVWAVPDASQTCVPERMKQGDSIALLDWDNPFHTERRGVSIGIPGSDAYIGERFAEAYIPANRVFTLNVGAGGGTIYSYYGCSVATAWTPRPGQDYEAVFDYGPGMCHMKVATVAQNADGAVVKTPITDELLKRCKK